MTKTTQNYLTKNGIQTQNLTTEEYSLIDSITESLNDIELAHKQLSVATKSLESTTKSLIKLQNNIPICPESGRYLSIPEKCWCIHNGEPTQFYIFAEGSGTSQMDITVNKLIEKYFYQGNCFVDKESTERYIHQQKIAQVGRMVQVGEISAGR
jgi:hypothetical protein